jgi:hypothetical protein
MTLYDSSTTSPTTDLVRLLDAMDTVY